MLNRKICSIFSKLRKIGQNTEKLTKNHRFRNLTFDSFFEVLTDFSKFFIAKSREEMGENSKFWSIFRSFGVKLKPFLHILTPYHTHRFSQKHVETSIC